MTLVKSSPYVAPIHASYLAGAAPEQRGALETPWPVSSRRGFVSGNIALNLAAATMVGAGVALFAPPVAAGLTGLAAFVIFSKTSRDRSDAHVDAPRRSWFAPLADRVDIERRVGVITITPKPDENAFGLWRKIVTRVHEVLPSDVDFPRSYGYAWRSPDRLPLQTLREFFEFPRSSSTFAGLVVVEETEHDGYRVHVVPEKRLHRVRVNSEALALELGTKGPTVPIESLRFMQGYAYR